jgi:hypothetical protein
VLPTKYRFIWLLGFRGEDILRNIPTRNKNCLWRPCLLTDGDYMNLCHRGLSIDASCPVSLHLAKWFQRRKYLKNRPIRNMFVSGRLYQRLFYFCQIQTTFNKLKIMSIISILSRPIYKQVCHRNFLFLTGQFLKSLLL